MIYVIINVHIDIYYFFQDYMRSHTYLEVTRQKSIIDDYYDIRPVRLYTINDSFDIYDFQQGIRRRL